MKRLFLDERVFSRGGSWVLLPVGRTSVWMDAGEPYARLSALFSWLAWIGKGCQLPWVVKSVGAANGEVALSTTLESQLFVATRALARCAAQARADGDEKAAVELDAVQDRLAAVIASR